jgi:hypothetical protein
MLFLGNSHTGTNDLTGMVEHLLESDGSGRRVTVSVRGSGFLGDFASQPEVIRDFKAGKWTYIVLQGTKMSSSHKYRYEQETAIAVCKAAVASGSKTLLFPEWPRRGWDETEWILNHYRNLAKQSGAKIVPVPRCWDVALRSEPKLDLWFGDGNHSNMAGAYLAAAAFYYSIAGTSGSAAWRPPQIPPDLAKRLRGYAREAVGQN